MSVGAAFAGVVLVWSTTPLAIKWSSDGLSFVEGLTGRMLLGFALLVALHLVLRRRLPLDAAARRVYAAAGLGIYGAMMCVYWAAQYIPSGWVSLMGGFMPMVTGALAALVLGERAFVPTRLAGMVLGLAGLALLVQEGSGPGSMALAGLAAAFASNCAHAASAVWLKWLATPMPALATVTGGIGLSLPLYVASWWVLDGSLPGMPPLRTLCAVAYLGVFGSVVGFLLYYYVLARIEASRTALVSLATPVAALLLGHLVNDEPLGPRTIGGAALILAGLLAYESSALRSGGWRARNAAGRAR